MAGQVVKLLYNGAAPCSYTAVRSADRLNINLYKNSLHGSLDICLALPRPPLARVKKGCTTKVLQHTEHALCAQHCQNVRKSFHKALRNTKAPRRAPKKSQQRVERSVKMSQRTFFDSFPRTSWTFQARGAQQTRDFGPEGHCCDGLWGKAQHQHHFTKSASIGFGESKHIEVPVCLSGVFSCSCDFVDALLLNLWALGVGDIPPRLRELMWTQVHAI